MKIWGRWTHKHQSGRPRAETVLHSRAFGASYIANSKFTQQNVSVLGSRKMKAAPNVGRKVDQSTSPADDEVVEVVSIDKKKKTKSTINSNDVGSKLKKINSPLLLDMAVQTSISALSPPQSPEPEEEEEEVPVEPTSVPPLPPTVSTNVDIEGLLRAARSTGPREVLLRLAVQRHMLTLQLSAVRIQTVVRQYQAKRRVQQIRRHVAIFLQKTKEIAYDQILEEYILSETMSLVMSVMKTQERYLLFRESIDRAMMKEVNQYVEEVLEEECMSIVVGCVKNAVDVIMSLKPVIEFNEDDIPEGEVHLWKGYSREEIKLRRNKNPLIQCLIRIIDEVVNPNNTISTNNTESTVINTVDLENQRILQIRPVVIESILEESEVYLLRIHSEFVYEEVIEHEIMWKMMREVLFDLLIDEEELLETLPMSWWMMKKRLDEEEAKEKERLKALEGEERVITEEEKDIERMAAALSTSKSRANLHLVTEIRERHRDLANELAKQIWQALNAENVESKERRRTMMLQAQQRSQSIISKSPRNGTNGPPATGGVRPISATRSVVANRCASSFVEDLLLVGSKGLADRMKMVQPKPTDIAPDIITPPV